MIGRRGGRCVASGWWISVSRRRGRLLYPHLFRRRMPSTDSTYSSSLFTFLSLAPSVPEETQRLTRPHYSFSNSPASAFSNSIGSKSAAERYAAGDDLDFDEGEGDDEYEQSFALTSSRASVTTFETSMSSRPLV